MSVESLPYTLLLLLAQFTAGVAALVLFVQVRGTFEPAFVRTCSWMTASSAALLTITAIALDAKPNAGGYLLDSDVLTPIKAASMAILLFSVAYVYFLRKEDETFLSHMTGATTMGLGIVLLVLVSTLVRLPTWSVAGVVLTMFAGAITIGTTTVAMVWGHWYLVKPSLEEGPLNELSLIAIGALLAELAITALNAIVPVGTPFESNALLAVDLATNPAFWLRVGIGLLFPLLLTFMAYKSSTERSMMSATGLLYIAVGALLAGEALGRGLLFVTGAPV